MPDIRVQDEQGTIHVFPDGSTPEMIAQAMGVKPPAPQSALEQFRSESIGGRLLDVPGALAATGEAAKGILKGAGKTVANLADSALTLNRFTPSSLAMSTAAKLTKTPDINAQATSTAQNAIQDVSQRYLTPTNREQKAGYYGEGAAEVVAPMLKGAGVAAEALPSAERAGAGFKDVMGAAKDVPLDLQNAQQGILRLMDWQKKAQLGPTINKFLNRVTNPKLGQITYEDARDFYSLLKNLSMDEASKLARPIRFDLNKMLVGLKADVGNAAGQVGKAQQYYSAMKEFSQAKRLEDISDASKDIILEALKRSLPYGIGTGIGAYGVKKIVDATR
jgi:hypothetical protein